MLNETAVEPRTSRDLYRIASRCLKYPSEPSEEKEPAMTVPFPPDPPNPPNPSNPPTPARPPSAERPGDTLAIGILTGLMVLGVLILLGLALTGLIWTPWQTFPADTTPAGVLAEHGFNLIVGVVVAIPAAVGVLLCGHVALRLVRRKTRARPDGKRSGMAVVTMVLVGGVVVGYLALAMQIFFFFTVKTTD
jgi:hypothetical protein